MIKPFLAEKHKICVVFDTVPIKSDWTLRGASQIIVREDEDEYRPAQGLEDFVKMIQTHTKMEWKQLYNIVSVQVLASIKGKAKAKDFAENGEALQVNATGKAIKGAHKVYEFFQTYQFNVVMAVGAVASEKLLGYKPSVKQYGKPLQSELYPHLKVVPSPNPAQAAYKPEIVGAVAEAIKTVVKNKDFSELREEEKKLVEYEKIHTMKRFKQFIGYYKSDKVKAFSFDTETTGFGFKTANLLTIQFSHKEGKAYILPTDYYGLWTPTEWDEIKREIRGLFNDTSKTIIAHNLKFDALFLKSKFGVEFRKTNSFDTMLASFVIGEHYSNKLKELSVVYTDMGDYEHSLERWKASYLKANKVAAKDFSYALIPYGTLAEYAGADADCTFRLYNIFKAKLEGEHQDQQKVFDMLMRFQYLLSVMEYTGSPVDVAYAESYLAELGPRIEALKEQLLQLPCVSEATKLLNETSKKPVVFNFNSVNHKRVLFFDHFKLRFAYFSKIKTDYGTYAPNGTIHTPPFSKWGWQETEEGQSWLQTPVGKHWKVETDKRKERLYLFNRLYKEIHGPTFEQSLIDGGKKPLSRSDASYEIRYKKEIAATLRAKASADKRSMKAWASEESTPDEAKTVIKLLAEYSQLVKFKSTYVESVLEKTVEGRIHPKFNVTGTSTGRLSCSDPNYMQIPAHAEEAKKVKRITKAPEGWVLCGSDLSAAEMRYVTVASGDEKMAEVFNSGLDSHGAIAKEIFDLDCHPNEVKTLFPKERQISKAAQFLSIYLGTSDALAATAGISEEKANAIWKAYFDKYSGIKKYLNDTEEYLYTHGYTLSMLGRKNRHPLVKRDAQGNKSSLPDHEIGKALRMATNATIQSVSSDGMLLSACNLQDEIEEKQLPMEIINIIHDALYVLVREDFIEEGTKTILKHLTKWPEGLRNSFSGELIVPPIPMVADSEIGPSWDKLKDIEVFLAEQEYEDEDE